MSIILKALKKLQEENSKDVDDATGSAATGGETALRAAQADTVEDPSQPQKTFTEREGAGQRFGFGPKTLLLVVFILGIFTTGWFASRIYLSVNGPEDPGEPAQQPGTAPAIVSKAAAPVPEHTVQPTAGEAAHSPPEAPGPAAQPAVSPPAQPVAVEAAPQPAATEPDVQEPAPDSPAPARASPEAKEPKPAEEGRPTLKINAIAWKNREPKAVVNMQTIYEGDVVEGATVLAIQRKAILFEYKGETFEVRF
jgi:hypothetical protein